MNFQIDQNQQQVLQSLSPRIQSQSIFSKGPDSVTNKPQIPALNFRYGQNSPNSQINQSKFIQSQANNTVNRSEIEKNYQYLNEVYNDQQTNSPSQYSNSDLQSAQESQRKYEEQAIKNKRDEYLVDKPLKTQDSNQSEGSQQMESIYLRIQNLRRNIQNQQPAFQQFQTYNQKTSLDNPQENQRYQAQSLNFQNFNQSNHLSSYSYQLNRDTTTFGNQTDHQIVQNMDMFNDYNQTQNSLNFPQSSYGQKTYHKLQESERSQHQQMVQSGYSQESNERQLNYPTYIIHQNDSSSNNNIVNLQSPIPPRNLIESERILNEFGLKQNLSPKLLSTHGDLYFQQSEIEMIQSSKKSQNGLRNSSLQNSRQQNQFQNFGNQPPVYGMQTNQNLYTFNNQSSINTMTQEQLSNHPQLVSIQDLIRESEERVKQETEQRFLVKIQELEKRSLYLDRSLELIEDMKQKFQYLDNQSNDYNSLLVKYNNLLYQFNSQGQPQKSINVSVNDYNNHSKSNLQSKASLQTLQNQIKRGETSLSKKIDHYQRLPENLTLDFLSNNHSMIIPDQKQKSNLFSNQSMQDLRYAQMELQNQVLKDQNEQLQIEIERIKLEKNSKKSGSRKTSPKQRSSSLRNLRQKSHAIISIGGSINLQNQDKNILRNHNKITVSGQTSRSIERNNNLYRSQENIQLNSNRKRPIIARTNANDVKSSKKIQENLEFLQRQTFVDLHKKIDKLEKEKKQLLKKLKSKKDLQNQAEKGPISENLNEMPLKCCCQDLKLIYEDRQKALEQIAEHWKHKTQQLVGKYYKSLQIVREDQLKLRSIAVGAVEQLRLFQEQALSEIISRQSELQLYYEKKVKNLEKQNKKISKRLVKNRNTQKLKQI